MNGGSAKSVMFSCLQTEIYEIYAFNKSYSIKTKGHKTKVYKTIYVKHNMAQQFIILCAIFRI